MSAIIFNNTVLRDGHQSMAATRMSTKQMLPAAAELDSLGFGLLETWGGASIDSCLRFLGEQPFDRIRALGEAAPKTPQSMLLRGQNIVQYTCFPDDVVEAFCQATAEAGMHCFRIFDALNDPRNVSTAIAAVRKTGKHARGEICYTTSPVHTTKAFVQYACALKEMGVHDLCIKDMAGVIVPQVAYELIKAMKQETGLPVTLHSHDTAGLAAASYLAAVEAGAHAVETSISPFANGTSQPDTLRMMFLLEGHPRQPKYNRQTLASLRDYFTKVYAELSAYTSHANEVVESDTLIYQVPGGMLSNFRVQLKDLGMADKQAEVLAEIPYVRQCLGWPPLVTPISQIVGTQSMLNVKFGRWKNFSPAAMDIALGNYGQTPGPIDPEVLAIAEKNTGKSRVTARVADSLAPRMDSLYAELKAKGLPETKEAAVLFAMFPREYEAVATGKFEAPKPPAPKGAANFKGRVAASQHLVINIAGDRTEVLVEELEDESA